MTRINLNKFIPPDKSSLIRQFLFSLLTLEKVEVENISNLPLDINTAFSALAIFGKKINIKKSKIEITGPPQKPGAVINCENSATVLHLLMGICILKGWKATFTGDKSLMKRDHSPFFEAAALYGCEILTAANSITVVPSADIPCVEASLTKQSAQLKGFHLICMLKSGGVLKYDAPTRKNTEFILEKMGAKIKESDKKITVFPSIHLTGYSLPAHRDPSSAFIAACASIISGVDFKISGIYPEKLRMASFEYLENMGIKIAIEESNNSFTVKNLEADTCFCSSLHLSIDQSPSFIDEIPFIAYMAARAGESFMLIDGSWLKNKECNRVKVSVELIGLVYESFLIEEGFAVMPEEKKNFASEMVHYDDHRMEMLSALIALDRNIPFEAGSSVAISFPMFPEMIKSLKIFCEKNLTDEIDRYRKKIDRIDDKIVKLISERAAIATEIIKLKKTAGMKISDIERENIIISRLSRYDNSISDLVSDLYRRIFDWIKRK